MSGGASGQAEDNPAAARPAGQTGVASAPSRCINGRAGVQPTLSPSCRQRGRV